MTRIDSSVRLAAAKARNKSSLETKRAPSEAPTTLHKEP